MRNFIRAAIALVIVVAAYWGWALIGAAQLASATSQGDAEAVLQRVDLQALIRSLSSQISRAYLDQDPQLHGLTGGVVVNAAAAEMLLRAFLTPENIAALPNKGRGVFPDSGASIWRMPLLSEAFRASPPQALMNSCSASLRNDLAPVGPRLPRASQRSAGAGDRAEGRRVDRAPRGVIRPNRTGRFIHERRSSARICKPRNGHRTRVAADATTCQRPVCA
jgi:hypothetical protein